MTVIAHIDDYAITDDAFIKYLKLDNQYAGLMENLVIDKLTAVAAKKLGVSVSAEEIQQRVDDFRRLQGLHRAKDTFDYLDSLGVTLDEFETYMTDVLLREKARRDITGADKVKAHFRLHSPSFDSVDISHIVVDSEGKAREILSCLEDDPDSFALLAQEHSLDIDTRHKNGYIGNVCRGALPEALDAKVFGSEPGDLLGPLQRGEGMFFEIFRIDAKHKAQLDHDTEEKIKQILFQEWLRERAQEHRVEVV